MSTINNTNNQKGLLQLVMIVKNGSDTIKDTIMSYVPFVDYVCILDTGSTDGTQDIINKIFLDTGIRGDLHQEPFISFPESRNRAFELAHTSPFNCTYSIMPDALISAINHKKNKKIFDFDDEYHINNVGKIFENIISL